MNLPDIDHRDIMADEELLEALPPQQLTQEELEYILGPATKEEQVAGKIAARKAADEALAFLDAAVDELTEEG